MRRALPRRLPAVTAGLALVLCGCGGSESEQPSTKPAAAKPAPTASAAAPGSGGAAAARRVAAPQPQPAPGDLANFSCTRRRGVWSARGDVSNSAQEPMVYTVTVVTIAAADVAGEDTEQVLLRPGESTGIELPAISRGAADTCTPRVVRTPR